MRIVINLTAAALLSSVCVTAVSEGSTEGESSQSFTTRGFLIRTAVGISMCTGPESGDPNATEVFQCDSLGEQKLGPAFGGCMGWRFGPVVAAEVGFTFTSLGVERREDKGIMISKLGRWFAPRVGARIYPLGSRFRAEPVLGVHLGYVRLEGEPDLDYSCDICPSIKMDTSTDWLHGVLLDLGIGFEVHVTDSTAINLEWTAFENFWIERCSGHGFCEEFDGDFDDWFFNLDLGITVIFG